jgi:hypothetical protein
LSSSLRHEIVDVSKDSTVVSKLLVLVLEIKTTIGFLVGMWCTLFRASKDVFLCLCESLCRLGLCRSFGAHLGADFASMFALRNPVTPFDT